MKIEKLNDNQIRCTLNKSDLASRQLKISELAYGSEKAKDLFRDMMQQASYEFGFEADDIPLMIEAIPVSTDCIVLVITKVEDPEELDTRFSKFAPSITGDIDEMDLPYDMEETFDDEQISDDENEETDNNGADDVINLFNKVKDYLSKNIDEDKSSEPGTNHTSKGSEFIPFSKSLKDSATPADPAASATPAKQVTATDKPASHERKEPEPKVTKIYQFHSLSRIEQVSAIVSSIYDGDNSLFKNEAEGLYYLVMNRSDCSVENFNKICNIISEYGEKFHNTYASEMFFEEHFEPVIRNKAVQVLATL